MIKLTHPRSAFAWVALSALLAGAASGCGAETNGPPATPVNPALAIDADPLALFPAGAVALGNLDARAFYASGSSGAQIASLGESALPLGQEVGFVASRDVDRMLVAVYVVGGVDAVAVLSGRFDVAKIQASVAARATTRTGVPWLVAPYAGHTLYAASSLAFAPLTDHTMAAGSESAVRRLLDRLAQAAQGGPRPAGSRELPDWMIKTVETPGSALAVAADVAAIPPAALQGFPMPAPLAGLSKGAVVGDFHPPGLNIAGTLAYGNPGRATAVADSLRQIGALVAVAGKYGAGPELQNLTIATEGANVVYKFVLDDEAMRRTLGSLSKVTGGRPPG